jgi:hypothetical protein
MDRAFSPLISFSPITQAFGLGWYMSGRWPLTTTPHSNANSPLDPESGTSVAWWIGRLVCCQFIVPLGNFVFPLIFFIELDDAIAGLR